MSPTVSTVHPKFTPGSPAQVDHETAVRVAHEEIVAWVDANPGISAERNPCGPLGYPCIGEEFVKGRPELREIVVTYSDDRGWRYAYDVITDENWRVRLSDVSAEHPFGPREKRVAFEVP